MASCITIGPGSIRLCTIDEGHINTLQDWHSEPGEGLGSRLAAISLPKDPGPVTVALDHPDMLIRSIIQPPAAAERMERMVRFELETLLGEQAQETLCDWTQLRSGGIDDARILALCVKRSLVDQIRSGLEAHGATLRTVTHPGLFLYQAYRHCYGSTEENAALVDCDLDGITVSLIENGELLYLRCHQPGMDQLVADVADLRGIDRTAARDLIERLGTDAPQDLQDLIQRSAISLATLVGNDQRFAQAQLKLARMPQIDAVYLSGAGGRLPLLRDQLRKRLNKPVRILNPFAGTMCDLAGADMDILAQLPSPFTTAAAGARGQTCELDALAPVRAQRRNWLLTTGVLQAAAAAAVVLLVLAVLNVMRAQSSQTGALVRLGIEPETGTTLDAGLIGTADRLHERLDEHGRTVAADRQLLDFLDSERRPARITAEFLSLIAAMQDPNTFPIRLDAYRMDRSRPGLVQV
ncbi:MAG: pilus assembly protein PilM, partial [Planctomycetota bacterium]